MHVRMIPWDDEETKLSVFRGKSFLDDDLYDAFLRECGDDIVKNRDEIDVAVGDLIALLNTLFQSLRDEQKYKDMYAKYALQQKGRNDERQRIAELERTKAEEEREKQTAKAIEWLKAHIYKCLLKNRSMTGREIATAISDNTVPDFVHEIYWSITAQRVYENWNAVKTLMDASSDGHIQKYDDFLAVEGEIVCKDKVVSADTLDNFVFDNNDIFGDYPVDDDALYDEKPVYDDTIEEFSENVVSAVVPSKAVSSNLVVKSSLPDVSDIVLK